MKAPIAANTNMLDSFFDAVGLYLRTLASNAYDRPTIAIELLIIGTVIYAVLRFLHGTRGARLLQGLLVLLVIGFLGVKVMAERFGWDRILVLYQSFAWLVFLTSLVVFQPELRRGLMRLGEARWMRRWTTEEIDAMIAPIAAAAALLSKSKIGALVAIEREVPLGGIADNGVRLDARLSVDLLHTIFWPNSMLHDMGVVVQRGRVLAAGVQFPLAESGTLDRRLGSRHRAAVGVSAEYDALVIVVSEETGTISVADGGKLIRGVQPDELQRTLRDRFLRGQARRGWLRRRRRMALRRPADASSTPSTEPGDSAGGRKLEVPT